MNEYGVGRCPECKKIYDTSMMSVRNKEGFPICPKCKVELKGVKLRK